VRDRSEPDPKGHAMLPHINYPAPRCEIYALFKLLGDKNLFAGGADLKKVENLFYPIIKIIRNETCGNYEYEINGDLVVVSGGKEKLRIPIKTFSEQAVKLL
jgi:hypothetical protein